MVVCVWLCVYGCVCMGVYAWLCMYGSVCMVVYVWLCMYGSVCMVVYVWECMYGSVCMGVYVLKCMYGSVCMGVYEVPARGACRRAQAGSGTDEPSAQPCQHTGIHGEIALLSEYITLYHIDIAY